MGYVRSSSGNIAGDVKTLVGEFANYCSYRIRSSDL